MIQKLKNLLRFVAVRVTHHVGFEVAYRATVAMLSRSNPSLLARVGTHQKESAHLNLHLSSSIEVRLDEIHSEATLNERKFLYHFFASIWSGENTVVEIGPFLGGTTRAIALGMEANPRLSSDSHLLTFDRFSHYYDAERLKGCLEPLISRGILKEEDFVSMGSRLDFFELFRKIHQDQSYSHRLEAFDRPVPDRKEDVSQGNYFDLEEGVSCDAVFIDGCKSWFGTKYFMKAVCKSTSKGTYFIFQDYGHYTCFWIAAFVSIFEENFRLVAYIDDTYTFVLNRELKPEEIEIHFPDNPQELSEERFISLFEKLEFDALKRGDHRAVLRHKMHKAAALAYIDSKERAKSILNDLYRETHSRSHRQVIKTALVSPTYTPDGEVLLN